MQEGQLQQRLLAEIAYLQREVKTLQHEKADLTQQLQTLKRSDVQPVDRNVQQAEAQLQTVLNAVPGGVSLISADGHYLWVNTHLARLFDKPPEDFIGQKLGFLEGGDQFTAFITQFLASSQSKSSETVDIQVSGALYHYLMVAQKYQQDQSIVLVGIDISDRIRDRQRIQEQETLLKLVLDNIPQLIFWKDCDSRFLGCNQAWAKAAGLDRPEEVIGKTDFEICDDPARAIAYMEHDRCVIETNTPELHHIDYRTDKGLWYETNKIPIHDEIGNVIGVLGTSENITYRKQAEESLRIAEEKYHSIFEHALEGIYQATPDGSYLSVNPAMARIHGYHSAEEMIANATTQHVYVDPGCRHEFQRLVETQGVVQGFEYQVYRQDGSIIWVSDHSRAVRKSDGELLYYEGIVEDITQRKQLEEELKQQVKELQIEIDQAKRASEVAAITQSDYFQELQAEVDSLRITEE